MSLPGPSTPSENSGAALGLVRPPTIKPRPPVRLGNLPQKQTLEIAFALPRRVRWRLFRQFGGREKKWVQWIYDADGEYSLRPMRELNCIFVHIPKAAGTAITHALFGNKGGAHASVDDYLSVFGSFWFDSAFKFTFVRNPWSRTVSAFEFLKQGTFDDRPFAPDVRAFVEENLSQYATAEEFIRHGLGRPHIMEWPHFRPQHRFLVDSRSGVIGVDFIGRHETIDADFKHVCEVLRLETSLLRRNARRGGDTRRLPSISQESYDKIADIYSTDLDLLGYRDFSFDKPRDQPSAPSRTP